MSFTNPPIAPAAMPPATYFDGLTATAVAVEPRVEPAALTIRRPDAPDLAWRWADISLAAPPAPGAPLTLGLGVQRLIVNDDALARSMIGQSPALRRSLARFAPWPWSRWLAGVAGAACVAVAIFLGLRTVPALLAPVVPYSWEEGLGQRVMLGTGLQVFECRKGEGDSALQDLVDRLAAQAGWRHDLHVHIANISIANAFALPGGHIVVFRGLIDRADTGDEVAGVLAHEIGHVVHRHAMQQVLRELGLSLFGQLLTGGATGNVNTSMIGYGTTVWQLSYSRDAESDADAFAVQVLRKAGLRNDGLKQFFESLDDDDDDEDRPSSLQWLSTHPATADRIAAMGGVLADGKSAFTDVQWRALHAPCSSLRKF